MRQGSHIMTMPKFEPKTFIDLLIRHKPTYWHLVPPLISFLANSPDIKKEHFSCVKNVMTGAAPFGKGLAEKLLTKVGKDFYLLQGYGMTELSPLCHILPESTKNQKLDSIGALVPGTKAKCVDLDGNAVGLNQPGELCIKGPQVMKGYFKNEKATKETIDNEGWLHTGDIAVCEDDNLFYIVDRLKELIKVSGLQVAPSELEDILRSHPEVMDVAVIGVPDEKAGELPRAYIVPKSNKLREADINGFLDEKVSKHKKLKGGIEFVTVIPKAASGKILRRELKQEYLSKHPQKKT